MVFIIILIYSNKAAKNKLNRASINYRAKLYTFDHNTSIIMDDEEHASI